MSFGLNLFCRGLVMNESPRYRGGWIIHWLLSIILSERIIEDFEDCSHFRKALTEVSTPNYLKLAQNPIKYEMVRRPWTIFDTKYQDISVNFESLSTHALRQVMYFEKIFPAWHVVKQLSTQLPIIHARKSFVTNRFQGGFSEVCDGLGHIQLRKHIQCFIDR